jgi:signal peptidase I
VALGKKKFISQEYSTQNKGKNIKDGTKSSRGVSIIAGVFFSFALIIGVGLIAFTIVFFYAAVDGTSMMYVLNASGDNTDSVIVNRQSKPKRGDIIVVNHYDAHGNWADLHIKRLIALGGESIHFKDMGDRYEIEVYSANGTLVSDARYPTLKGNNEKNLHYDTFYSYQEQLSHGKTVDDLPDWWKEDEAHRKLANQGAGNPAFRTHFMKNGERIPFLQYSAARNQYEYKLPSDYIFYMGDNRGGANAWDIYSYDFKKMSLDCTYFGPQPVSSLVGVVKELVHNKSAPKWFIDKIIWYVTFKWI